MFFNFLKKNFLNIIFLLISIIYILLSNSLRTNFFHPLQYQNHLFVYNSFSYLLIIFVGQFLCELIKSLRNKNQFYFNFSIAFTLILFVHLLIFFLTNKADFNWYSVDSAVLRDYAMQLNYDCWYNILSVIYFIIAYCIFPFKSGVILFQILVFSFLMSFIYAKISILYNYKFKWLMLFPLFPFYIVRFNIQSISCCIYYVFLILLFALIYFIKKRKTELKFYEGILLSFFISVLCFWRAENLIYLFIVPILYLYFVKMSKIKYIIFVIVFYLCFFSFNKVQMFLGNYSYLPFRRPIAAIARTDFKSNQKENDIKIISEVYDYQLLKDIDINSSVFLVENGENKKFIKLAIKLILMNFKTYLKDRINMSHNFTKFNFFNDKLDDNRDMSTIEGKTISFLETLNFNDYPTLLTKIVYNPIIPFFIVIFAFFYFIVIKNSILIIISGLSILNTVIVYMTCPEPYLHYFIQVYIIGYYFLCYAVTVAMENIYKKTHDIIR